MSPAAGLTELNRREYRTAGALLGEAPVTGKPGHAAAGVNGRAAPDGA
eukprot:SAG11_NODE_27434_length_332_cov_2.523605_1_plen_47_part_10